MTGLDTFEYAVLQLVPSIERGERLNVAVLLHCRYREHLAYRSHVDPRRWLALAPTLDTDAVIEGLAAWERSILGDGPSGSLSAGERFRWLTAPRSTMLQPGPVHTGLTADPEAEIGRLADRLLR